MHTDEHRLLKARWLVAAPALMAMVLLLSAGCTTETESRSGAQSVKDHEAAAMDWRERRLNRLTEPYGWLSLVGLDFVNDGEWRLGSDETMDLVMPAGPEFWGTLVVDGDAARFEPAAEDVEILAGEAPVSRTRIYPYNGEPVFVTADSVRFQIIERKGILGVRTRWPQATARVEFQGLDYFDFNPDWVIEARFEYNEPGATMPVASVLGDLIDEPNLGRAVFEFDGREFSLEAVGDEDDEEMFFIFADRTSGRETYGLGRFLYADAPEDGRILLDFNRAYNPPCAFNEFTTCPLPPPENRLDVRVEAGELAYAGEGGWRAENLK